MDPGWPYAYNRLVAATSGQTAGNFAAHITNGSSVSGIVQPTGTVPGSVNPYGSPSFLSPPPSVGYDVFSTLFHPHGAQVNSQTATNLKTLNYGTAIDVTQGRSSQQHEASNSSPISTASSTSQHATHQSAVEQQYYQDAATSSSGSSSHQQLQFGMIPHSISTADTSASNGSTLATITRVNSNGCGTPLTAVASTTAALYDNYNAQLKAHPLYQLNSHLANAAVMAMANKLNANRNSFAGTLQTSQVNSNNGTVGSSPSPNGNGSNGSNNYSSNSDRSKHQLPHQHLQYANQNVNKANSSGNDAIPSPSPKDSIAIPLIQFEAARLQQQQQQQQAKAASQQSSPISYSMWTNNSPVQNKFNSCEVAQQQQQQQQLQTLPANQIQNLRRPPAHSPNPVQSAFTQQPQQSEVAGNRTHNLQSQQHQRIVNQDALYNNARVNKSNSAVEYSTSSNNSNSNQSNSMQNEHQSNSRSTGAVAMPRRPSPMEASHASPLGQNVQGSGYGAIYGASMNIGSQHQHHQYPSNNNNTNHNNARDQPQADTNFQLSQMGKTHTSNRVSGNGETPMSYSSVITRVAGSAWSQAGKAATSQESTGGTTESQQANRVSKQPAKKKMPSVQEESNNRPSWPQQLSLLSRPSYESPSMASNTSSEPSINRSALQQQQQQQSALYRGWQGDEDQAEEMEKKRTEIARSQVVVPDIMEELNFLSSDNIKASSSSSSSNKKGSGSDQTKSTNGRVQIISVEAAGKSSAASKGIAAPTPVTTINAKKPDEKGFIGSYLKFLQGDTNHLGIASAPGFNRQRKVGGGGQTAQAKRKNNNSGQKQEESSTENAPNVKDTEVIKRSRPNEGDDQGYVPNGGATAFDANYQQSQQQSYQHQQYVHPLSLAGAHYQGQMAANGGLAPIHAPQNMLPHQPYTPATEADGFNYFDLQFRPRW